MKKLLFYCTCVLSGFFLLLSNTAFAQLTCADGSFYDSGGIAAPYSNGENVQTVICPGNVNQYVELEFTLVELEDPGGIFGDDYYDILRVYDGTGTANEFAGSVGGAGVISPTTFTSTTADGCITVLFTSDSGVTAEGWVAKITCLANNVPPVANDDMASTTDGVSVDIDVKANDSDTGGALDPASVTIAVPPANGTTSVDGTTGVVTYTPTPGFAGVDTFDYQICDNLGACTIATVVVNVAALCAPQAGSVAPEMP